MGNQEFEKPQDSQKHRNAVKVIFLFGLISLFGDMVYESMRGTSGQYMSTIGIEMTKFALILGIGEFLAYAIRLVAGMAADKSRKYWWFIYAGYGLLVVVPFMGITTFLPAILTIMMLERIGKALRGPAKSTILSNVADSAGGKVGMGFAFGIQEALDKLGAFLGPMIFTIIFIIAKSNGVEIGVGEYQLGYKLLIIPFVLLMITVFFAHREVRKHNMMEIKTEPDPEKDKLKPVFWIYTVFTFITMIGFAQFPLIAFHLKDQAIISDESITLFYAIVMATNALLAVGIGLLYDWLKRKSGNKHKGLMLLMFIPIAAAVIPFLTLGASVAMLIVGLILFGAVLAAHETIMKPAIADITSLHKRGTGYGIFSTAFGVAVLIGTSLFAVIYTSFGIPTLQIVLVATQVIAMIIFFVMWLHIKKNAKVSQVLQEESK